MVYGDGGQDYDTVQIYDDYNQPIGPRIITETMDNSNDDHQDDDDDDNYGDVDGDKKSERSEQQEEEDNLDHNNHHHNHHREHGHLIKNNKEKSGNMSIRTVQRKVPQNNNNDFRSLLVKVYRGPTRHVNKKPFASWGYFVKYPSDDNVPPPDKH